MGVKMEKNVGNIDRGLRLLAGIVVIYLAVIVDNKILTILFAVFATISVYESYVGFCGLYKLFNINTRR